MEIKGTEEELKKLFKKKENKVRKKLSDRFERFSKSQRTSILVAIVITMLVFVNVFLISYLISSSNDYLTQTECNSMIKESVTKTILYQEGYGKYYQIFFIYKDLIRFLLIAIAIGWILHGVGFRIL